MTKQSQQPTPTTVVPADAPSESTPAVSDQTETSLQEKVDAISVPPGENLIGTVVDEKYELVQLLGEGGMGHVYRARHVLMGKEFAVKMIHAELAHVNEIAKRFQREAKSSSLLQHPNCITVTDFGACGEGKDQRLYLVMELLVGEDLDERLSREKKIAPKKAVEIATQILKGLGHAHEQGVIHRDLKPENIYLIPSEGGEELVKILDFGIAKMADSQSDTDKLTKTGVVFGTPKYLSPEQALGDKIDRRSDLYAVGVILFEMLTGEPPFAGRTAMDVMSAHLTAAPPKLIRYGSFPRGMQRIIQKAMAKKPQHRFASAQKFIAALETIDYSKESQPTLVTSHVARQSLMVKVKDALRQSAVKLAAVLVLLGAGAIVAGHFLLSEPPKKRTTAPVAKPIVTKPDMPKVSPEEEQSKKMAALLADATVALDADEFRKAEIACRKALLLDGQNQQAKMLLGHVLIESGRQVDGVYQYQQVIDSDTESGKNDRLRANLFEGLQWDSIRKKAAMMLAEYGTAEDLARLSELASSALTAGDVRRDVRLALERLNKTANVDWISSLQADFRELKSCKERNAIIAQMLQTGTPEFIPFLEKFEIRQKRKTQKPHPNACLQANLKYALRMLKKQEPDTSEKPIGKESDEQ
ncbi:MAG: protein kinase [Deltaproteobacteria bacterium]|nr:protein kinase [Deltaproteobacteria bacterium]